MGARLRGGPAEGCGAVAQLRQPRPAGQGLPEAVFGAPAKPRGGGGHAVHEPVHPLDARPGTRGGMRGYLSDADAGGTPSDAPAAAAAVARGAQIVPPGARRVPPDPRDALPARSPARARGGPDPDPAADPGGNAAVLPLPRPARPSRGAGGCPVASVGAGGSRCPAPAAPSRPRARGPRGPRRPRPRGPRAPQSRPQCQLRRQLRHQHRRDRGGGGGRGCGPCGRGGGGALPAQEEESQADRRGVKCSCGRG
mmetsp:Transcript_33495/g.79463  ORF Transcript_33495/g.79463 Transcript_33495/m.79463 type:complete len:253 (-) Transcript_33495:287-1045(-)